MTRTAILVIAILSALGLAACAPVQPNPGPLAETSAASVQTAAPGLPMVESATEIKIGDTVESSRVHFTLRRIDFSSEIRPDNASGVAAIYYPGEDEIFIRVVADLKNIAKQAIAVADQVRVQAVYGDGYTYEGLFLIDTGNGSFVNEAAARNLMPLSKIEMTGMITAAEEVYRVKLPLAVYFTIDGQSYVYRIRS